MQKDNESPSWLTIVAVVSVPQAKPGTSLCRPLWLRWVSYRVAAGDVGPERWYETARTFEGLPLVRQSELLAPYSYLAMWQRVLTRVEDAEEMARQRERYQREKRRGG